MIRYASVRLPKGDWRRSHATACRIADELARWPELAALRYRRLIADVCARFGVARTTAAVAVRLFRMTTQFNRAESARGSK